MKRRAFTKKQIKRKIKFILNYVKETDLNGEVFPMTDLLGDYAYNYELRILKEVLFKSGKSYGPIGSEWFLRYPNKGVKKLTKKVMKFDLNNY